MTDGSARDEGAHAPSVLELVSESLFAVGWSAPADERMSFVVPEAGHWLPFQCYVLRSGTSALIIDTGVAAHRKQIETGLDLLLGQTTQRDVMLTRYNFDTLSNLPWLTRAYGVGRLFPARAAALPLASAHIIGFMDTFEEATIRTQLRAGSGLTPTAIPDDSAITIGDLAVNIVRPAVRIQATNWAYERVTKTLFCTDAWGFATDAREGGPSVVRSGDERISGERIERYFSERFDWLPGADTSEPAEILRTVFEEHDVERLCPSMGCVIEGRDVVEQVVELTLAAFERLSEESYRNQVVGAADYPNASSVGPPSAAT